jgi:hypothetical protein
LAVSRVGSAQGAQAVTQDGDERGAATNSRPDAPPADPSTQRKGRKSDNGKMVADGQVTPLQQVMACVMYGSVSISITLFNKAIFAVYKFQYPNVVTLLQASSPLPPFLIPAQPSSSPS